jgi:hypothetical protein
MVAMRRVVVLVFLGWAVLYSRHGGEWEQVGNADSSSQCEQIRTALVAGEATRDMDAALADQPADNPIRVQAMARELRNAGARYRCTQD